MSIAEGIGKFPITAIDEAKEPKRNKYPYLLDFPSFPSGIVNNGLSCK